MGNKARAGRGRWSVIRAGSAAGVALALCLHVSLAACAAAPDVSQEIAAATEAGGEAPRIVAAEGPLSAEESQEVLAEITDDPGEAGLLARHAALEQHIAETPLVAGNRIRLLRDGPETFHVVFDLIRNARNHVNIEFYILENVESDGVTLEELLLEKRRQGVAINVIYDSHGSQETPRAFFDRLRQAGVKVVEYNPLNPLRAKFFYSPNDRTHRKIVVVDGRVGVTGGINLSHTYQSTTSGGPAPEEGEPPLEWRDTSILIEGPVVAQFQALFVAHWRLQEGPEIDESGFFPEVPPLDDEAGGGEVVRIIGSTPEDAIPRYYVAVLTAIRNAELRVWLTASYFIPTRQELADLKAAARRGIDVRILVPGVSDIESAVDIARSHYAGLLEAGVRIWESHNVLLHSKTIVVDGVWSVVGSSNFDYRSVIFNDEVDAVVLGSDTAAELERMFRDDISEAREIELEEWRQRPFGQRAMEYLQRVWQSWL